MSIPPWPVCVPERNFFDDACLWDNAYLGWCVHWMMHPLNNASPHAPSLTGGWGWRRKNRNFLGKKCVFLFPCAATLCMCKYVLFKNPKWHKNSASVLYYIHILSSNTCCHNTRKPASICCALPHMSCLHWVSSRFINMPCLYKSCLLFINLTYENKSNSWEGRSVVGGWLIATVVGFCPLGQVA